MIRRIRQHLARRRAEKPERVRKRAAAKAQRLEHKRFTGSDRPGGMSGGGGG
jgi:hypothetical protein